MKPLITIVWIGLLLTVLPFIPITAQASESFTHITLEKTIHFSSMEGNDVIVPPGVYEVKAHDDAIHLTGKTEDSISLPTQSSTHDNTISNPHAMSFPIESDMHYLGLLLPQGQSLEAIGSYSGIKTRGFSFFRKPVTFTRTQQQWLKTFARKLAKTLSWNKVKKDWVALVQKLKRQKVLRHSGDVHSLVMFVMREATLSAQKEYKHAREQLKLAMRILADSTQDMTKTAQRITT